MTGSPFKVTTSATSTGCSGPISATICELPSLNRTAQHAGVVDLLLYFRNRRNWVRPYLSAGIGAAHTRADLRVTHLEGKETSVDVVMRVAVGVDLLLKGNLRFRYSFSESLVDNPFAASTVEKGIHELPEPVRRGLVLLA